MILLNLTLITGYKTYRSRTSAVMVVAPACAKVNVTVTVSPTVKSRVRPMSMT